MSETVFFILKDEADEIRSWSWHSEFQELTRKDTKWALFNIWSHRLGRSSASMLKTDQIFGHFSHTLSTVSDVLLYR